MARKKSWIIFVMFLVVVSLCVQAPLVLARPYPIGAEDIDNEVRGQLIDIDVEFSTIVVRQYQDEGMNDYQDWTFYVMGNAAIKNGEADIALEGLVPKSWVVVHYSVMADGRKAAYYILVENRRKD